MEKKQTELLKKTNLFFLLTLLISFLIISPDASALTKPTLLSPANNAEITTKTVTFSWSHPYNDQYELKIRTSGGTLKYASGKISSKSITVDLSSIPLTHGNTYKWYVVVYALGQEDSSEDRWFTYNFRGWVDVNSGVSVSPATVTAGQNFTVAFSLKEYHGGTTAFEYVELWVQNSGGSDLYRAQRWDNVSFSANQQRSFSAITYLDPAQGRGAGTYRAIVRGKVAGENPFNFGVVPGSGAVNPKTFTAVAPDTTKPVVSSFGVTPSSVSLGGSFSISYTVSDAGGSGLKQVELWRANDSGGSPSGWAQISTRALSGNGPTTGSFSNTPSAVGTYWYGLHVVDNAGNWSPEPSPRKVTVVADDHGNSCNTATAVNVNSSKAGTINRAGDWDYFRIQVPSSGTLTVYTTGSTDTYGFLKNSSCVDITSNDNYKGANFRIFRYVAAGTYYVAVRHYSSTGTGSYTLNVSFIPAAADDYGNSCTAATAVSVNSSKAGMIGSAGDIDYFRIQVPSSGTLTVYTTGSTDTKGSLRNSGCTTITGLSGNPDDYNNGSNFRLWGTVMAGTYYVAVQHYSSTGVGGYTLYISFTSPASDRFTWPVNPMDNTNGHYGVCGDWGSDSRGCYWINNTIENSATIWRDVQPFQEHYYSPHGYHLGADYNLGSGDYDLNRKVYPAAPGVISSPVMENVCGYGNIVFVKHTTSFGVYTSMYAHVNWLPTGKPIAGTSVTSSNPIALVGKGTWTPTATCTSRGSYPAHLHFEIRRGDNRVPGPAYSKPSRCNGSDSNNNLCPQRQIDPNAFIAAHN